MSIDKIHIRHCMLYEFKFKKSATKPTKSIFAVYGEDFIEGCTCQRRFDRFMSDHFDLNVNEHTGRHVEADDCGFKKLLETVTIQSSRDIAH